MIGAARGLDYLHEGVPEVQVQIMSLLVHAQQKCILFANKKGIL